MFFGRQFELSLLQRLYERQGAQFLVLYGRRRVGKTALVTHWLSSQLEERSYLYWMATQTSTKNQLQDFSQAIYRFKNPTATAQPQFSYQSWEDALEDLVSLAEEKRFVLVLDEITYVMQANPEVASLFQRVWDHLLQNSNLFLILTGSLAGIIQRTMLNYKAPLYGRASAKLKLQPLSFGTMRDLLPNLDLEQRVAVYAITGGIPAYIRLFDDTMNVISNLREQFLTPTNVMFSDAIFLLREQLDEPRNYMAILDAIANGSYTLSEIAKSAGLERSNTNKYLTILSELGYVERIVSATVQKPERSRKGRFVFKDAYMRFYFRFLRPSIEDIEQGRIANVVDLLTTHLVDFIGTHTYEELCREWLAEKADKDAVPHLLERVGSHWSKEAQIDVLGINWRTKQIVFGECKWGRKPIAGTVVDKLVTQSTKAMPTGDWQPTYMFFSRSDLTTSAREKLEAVGGIHISLDMLEADMHRWQH